MSIKSGTLQFKTLKYRPDFPDRFGSIEAARLFCRAFFAWYNDEHHHSGLGLHTPADIHYGTAEQTRQKRAGVLKGAYAAHPERFVRKPPSRRSCQPPPGSTRPTTRGGSSVISTQRCLIQVDRLRGGWLSR